MKITSIQNKKNGSRGRFQRIRIKTSNRNETITGRITGIGEKFITIRNFSGNKNNGQTSRVHHDSIVSIK